MPTPPDLRWRERRSIWMPQHHLFRPRKVGCLRSYLAGVAVFSVPMQPAALTRRHGQRGRCGRRRRDRQHDREPSGGAEAAAFPRSKVMQLGLFATPDAAPSASGGYPCDGWQVHSGGIWREGHCTPEPGTRIDSDGVARWLIGMATDSLEGSRWLSARLEGCRVVAHDGSLSAEVDPGFLPALQGWLEIEALAGNHFGLPAFRVRCWRGATGGVRLVAVVGVLRDVI